MRVSRFDGTYARPRSRVGRTCVGLGGLEDRQDDRAQQERDDHCECDERVHDGSPWKRARASRRGYSALGAGLNPNPNPYFEFLLFLEFFVLFLYLFIVVDQPLFIRENMRPFHFLILSLTVSCSNLSCTYFLELLVVLSNMPPKMRSISVMFTTDNSARRVINFSQTCLENVSDCIVD